MVDVRCPMCGKTNPAELEVCQYCQARLKPLVFKSVEGTSDKPDEAAGIEEEKTQPPSATQPDWDIPDWLKSLRPASGTDEESSAIDQEPPVSEIEDGSFGGTPSDTTAGEEDWLSSFRERGDLEGDVLPAGDPAAWLNSPVEDDQSRPDWLTDLRSAESDEPPSFVGADQPSDEDPDWLQRIRERRKAEGASEESTSAEPVEDLPTGTLKSGQEQIESFNLPPAIVPPGDAENEMPDWLSGLGDSAAEDEPKGLPDWLSGSAASRYPAQGTDLPDWLQSSRKETPPGLPVEPEKPQEPPETITSPLEPPTPSEEIPQESQIPSWLAGFITGEPTSAPDQKAPEEERPAWLSDLEKYAALDKEPSVKPETQPVDFDRLEPQGVQPSLVPEQIETEEPVEEVKSVAPFTFDEEDAGFISDDLPDWLKGVPAQDELGETPEPVEPEASLSPASLPVWLEAMRPVEAIAGTAPVIDESDQKAEGSGPLAGLRGILRAEPDVARQKKPGAYTIKLQVSESHQAHVALLENLIKAEGAVRPVSTGSMVTSQQILRWVIFVVLLLAVLWPVYTSSQSVQLPALLPETLDARGIIDALPDGSSVLVAVEYEPGYSGELDAAAGAILDHLMIKGAYLTLVSSSPVGPAQAERVIGRVNQAAEHSYQPISQYTNLGYIPGGAAGLQAFAAAPRRVLPLSLEILPDNGSIWDSAHLTSIRTLSDFAATLVITENPDTARAWIEQVQPALQGKPLIMVISAQAEALVRPYYAGTPQQVQGMIIGLSGGAGYESSMPRTGLARQYWDGFSLGLAAAVALIVIAGLVNILASFLVARRRPEGEA